MNLVKLMNGERNANPFVDLKAQYQSIKNEIDSAIAEVIANTAFIGGSYAKAFENDFARFCNAKYCVGVGNGTDALFIALKSNGHRKRRRSDYCGQQLYRHSEAITMTGAKVVFVDINPRHTISTQILSKKKSPPTKAIIPVHLYGQPADMDPILALARKHD